MWRALSMLFPLDVVDAVFAACVEQSHERLVQTSDMPTGFILRLWSSCLAANLFALGMLCQESVPHSLERVFNSCESGWTCHHGRSVRRGIFSHLKSPLTS